MKSVLTAAATAALITPVVSTGAMAATLVTGGSAMVEVTTPLLDYDLWGSAAVGSPPATINAEGNPVIELPNIATEVRDGGDLAFSQRVNGGYSLRVNGGAYLFPLSESGNPESELESFEEVLIFPRGTFERGEVSGDIAFGNFQRTETGDYVDVNSGEVVDFSGLTEAQIGALESAEIRTCCRNQISELEINTAEGTVDGLINGVRNRDINFDGEVNELDEFSLFTLQESGTEGVFDMLLTDTMAEFVNFAFSPANGDDFPLIADWARYEEGAFEPLDFMGGDKIGELTYTVETTTAPIPVPAALPLLALSLGAMGLVGRRRKPA